VRLIREDIQSLYLSKVANKKKFYKKNYAQFVTSNYEKNNNRILF